MNRPRSSFWAGVVVILVGSALLFAQLQPDLTRRWLGGYFSWPWLIVGMGIVFLLLTILGAGSGFAIPACVSIAIGAIFVYQVQTQDWESWSFIWALIPASAGLGMILSAMLRRRPRLARTGVWLLFANLILFGAFWAFFRRDSTALLRFWPVLLIGLGLVFIVQAFLPRNRS